MINVVVLGPCVDLTVFISEIYGFRCISAANIKNHNKTNAKIHNRHQYSVSGILFFFWLFFLKFQLHPLSWRTGSFVVHLMETMHCVLKHQFLRTTGVT